MMRRHLPLAALALLWGCGDGSIFLELPAQIGETVGLLSFDASGQPALAVHVVDEALVLRTEGTEVYLFVYGEPIDIESQRPCALIHPDRVFKWTEDAEEWVSASLDERVRTALVPGHETKCTACFSISERRLTIPDASRPLRSHALAPLGEEDVLLGTERGLYRVSQTAIELIEGCGTPWIYRLHALSGDRFWVQVEALDLELMRIEGNNCTVEQQLTISSSVATRIAFLGGGSEPGELYIGSERGGFFKVEATETIPLVELELSLNDQTSPEGAGEGGILRLGPESVVMSAGSFGIAWWNQGALQRSRLDLSARANTEINVFTALPSYGVTVGAPDGRVLYDIEPGRSETLPAAPIVASMGSIVEVNDSGRLLMTIGRGQIYRYDPMLGFCDTPYEVEGAVHEGSRMIARPSSILAADLIWTDAINATLVWLDID